VRRLLVGAAVLVVIALAGCTPDTGAETTPTIPESNALVSWFNEQYADATIVASALGDVTADGADDLVVIYQKPDEEDRRWMRVIVGGDEPVATDEVPAPVENQRIDFRDIDESPPTEVVVRGSKAGNVGFAIFRVVDGKLENVFGEDMDRCCQAPTRIGSDAL
jgi:hypothetical protein